MEGIAIGAFGCYVLLKYASRRLPHKPRNTIKSALADAKLNTIDEYVPHAIEESYPTSQMGADFSQLPIVVNKDYFLAPYLTIYTTYKLPKVKRQSGQRLGYRSHIVLSKPI